MPPNAPRESFWSSEDLPLPPKSSADLTDKDWQRVLKESKWNGNYNTFVFTRYLGVKSMGELRYDDYVVSEAYSVVPRYCLEGFIKEEGFTIDKLVWVVEDSDYSVEWSLVEIELDKKVNRVNGGQFFIFNGTDKYIIESKPGYHDDYFFKIVSRTDAKVSGDKFLEKFIKYTQEQPFQPYRKPSGIQRQWVNCKTRVDLFW